ncbi:SIR2 family protein [Saccharolobus shibatae]|uniref:Uncharacterized protein n=1 Tax=Saccharolobus shibatae TaxID=2286 RepID=A0A8F5C0V2_9CREN|nr:hypothetical protein [Saccharolobus shibatae]QXJ34998.1 hypothetical protein J5U22_01545 [Saccharolobus shibatae]
MEPKFSDTSFQFWRRSSGIRTSDILDPFAFSSELHLYGDFADPNPLFHNLLKEIYKQNLDMENLLADCSAKGTEDKLRVNFWNVKCPYCGEEFPYENKRLLRCPRCNNVVKKIDFRSWNENLETFLNGEISLKELYDCQVTPTSQNYEKLRDIFLDPDIPKTKIGFKIKSKGFNTIYKLFSPNQLLIISDIIKRIRKEREESIPIYSLALLDFITYNSMFSKFKSGKIYSMFRSKELRLGKWIELTQNYFCISLKKVITKLREKRYASSKFIASHPFTLDMEALYNIELFFYEWVKRPLSYSDGYTLIPRLFKKYIFSCMDESCGSFYEKEFEFSNVEFNVDKAVFYLDRLDYCSLLYLVSLKDFFISRIEKERNVFEIELLRGRKGVIPIWEIYAKVKKEHESDYLKVLSMTFREFTRYERILGIENDSKTILNHVFTILPKLKSNRNRKTLNPTHMNIRRI